jgi:hypothetical protein
MINNHIGFFRIENRSFHPLLGTTNEVILKQYYYDAYDRIGQALDCILTVAPLLYQQGPSDSHCVRFMIPP